MRPSNRLTGLDIARLDVPVAQIHEDSPRAAAIEHGLFRNGSFLVIATGVQFHFAGHFRLRGEEQSS